MMRKEQIETITVKVGNADAPGLIDKLNSLGVGEDIKLTGVGISIPKTVVTNIPVLQSELSSLSKVGRLYEISEEGERIIINTIKLKPSSLPKYSAFPRSTDRYNTSQKEKSDPWENPWGIREEHVELPLIPRGSKVLEVGAGTGFIAEKIRDTFSCDVYALEPSFERSSDYESCVKRLGEDHVEKLTLQEALESNPEKYFQAFDVVTVFKYNVPGTYKDDFLNSLAKTVKPNGTVFITSVEPERFYRDSFSGNHPYITETMQKYFGNVKITERRSFHGADGLMTCTEPRPSLEKKISFKKK